MKKTLLSALLALATAGAVAQQTEIYPIPQQVAWGSGKAFDNTAAYTLVGAAEADADAVALLGKHFTTEGGTVTLTIGERGDAAVSAYESLIPTQAEGYYLSVSADGVVIAGNDASGTYYGVQTYLQVAAQPEVQAVTITDWPDVGDRGLVEGYYGNPYSDADRKSLLEFFGRTKMNVYIYGPKDDPYHRDRWREDYPAAEAERLSELAAAAARHKVRFVWAMHPGGDIQWTDADRAASVAKLEKMYALGIRAFSIFFDDINGAEQSKGDKQAEYLNYLNENFVNKHDDVAPLILCPTHYCQSYTGGNDSYLRALGGALDEETHIMWTGAGVVDMINKSDLEWVNPRINRNAYIWLNYPVNDFCIDHMLMGPTYGNDLDIAEQLSGFVSNPMEYAEASKVSLYSIADYCWNMEAYDSQASWEQALQVLMPEHVEAFRVFCQHNVDLGPTGHGLRRQGESAAFKEAAEEFAKAMENGYDKKAVAAMTKQFAQMIQAADELLASTEEPEMIAEIAPWAQVMKIVGQRGEKVMNLYTLLNKGDEKGFIATYEALAQLEQDQKAVLSRNFEGSIKKPNPTVANEVVVPFIKANTKTLIREYKSNHTYRTDIFPADLIEEGRYYIKVNGRWLTDANANPDRVGDFPVLQAGVDSINPQRQEWNISIDPTTERYKITNAQDGRYIHEMGNFWRDKNNNPYDPAWHSFNIYRLNGKYAIQTAGNAGGRMWSANEERITPTAERNVRYEHFIFEIIPVGGATAEPAIVERATPVCIIDNEGRYLTNTNVNGVGGIPEFMDKKDDNSQLWLFCLVDETGRFSLNSAADGRYVNELCNFGTNAYNPLWNTYILQEKGGMYSIRNAGHGGNNYWVVDGNHPSTANIPWAESFLFKITKK